MIFLLKQAEKFIKAGEADSIRFSTRPDTIHPESLDLLIPYPVATIELGVQSMDDHVLARAKRGHGAIETQQAVALLKNRGVEIGLQMMVGLPGEEPSGSLGTGRKIIELAPDFVRVYPTVVLKGSLLAKWYEKRKYTPLPLEASVTLVKKLYLLFTSQDIRVVRMGLQSGEDLENGASILAGPYHPAFGHLVHSEIFLDMATADINKRKASSDAVTIKVHPNSISKMRGLKNKNIEILKKYFQIATLTIIPDASLAEDRLAVV